MRYLEPMAFKKTLESYETFKTRCWWTEELLEAIKRGDYHLMQRLMIVDFARKGIIPPPDLKQI